MLQESLTYKFIYMVYSCFLRVWQESLIAKGLRKCAVVFGRLFSNSAIFHFVGREGIVNRAYEGSILYKAVDGLLNLPQRIFHPQYKKSEQAFAESYLFRALVFFLDKLHLLTAGFLFIALVAPYDYWNNIYSTVAVSVLILLYFIRTIVEGRTGFQTITFNVFLVLFLICVVLAEVFSIMPSESLRFLAFYLTCFLLVLLLLVSVRTKKELSEVLTIILAGTTIAGLYGIYQYIAGVPVNPAWIDTTLNQGNMTRVYSVFHNPNDFAEVILIVAPFYFAAVFNTKNVLAKLVFLAMAVPPLLSLLMTLARGAWISIAVAALVYVFFKDKRLIPVFILLGIAAIPFLPQSILLRVKTMFNLADSSSNTRVDVWKTVIPILKSYWFTGLGLGNDTLLRVSKNYHSFVAKGSIPSHSHNLYLQVWLEVGFPGIITFLGLILTTIKKSIRTIVQASDAYINNILIAGLASMTGILANGMIEYVWFDRRVMLFFWAALGIIFAALSIHLKISKKSSGEAALCKPDSAEEEVA